MENTDLTRLVWLAGALILVLPAVIYALRDRRAVVRNIALWIVLIGAAVALFGILA